MVETVKQNILNAISWFYEQLKARLFNPIITMLMTGETYGWLMDENGNIIMSDDENGILMTWKLYEHNMIADDFDKSATYKAGDYCIYDNLLYKFAETKYAGDWDSSIVARVSVTSELEDFRTEYDAQTTSTLSTLSILRSDVDDNQDDIQNLQNDMDGAQDDIQDLQEDMSSAQEDIQTLQTQFEEEQTAIQTLKTQLEEEYSAIQALQTSYEEEHELIQTLQSHIEQHDEAIADIESEIKDLNEEMNNKLDWGNTSPSGDGDDNDDDDDPDDDDNDDNGDTPVGKI